MTLDRFNGRQFFVLSHLYAIGKAIAIAQCIALGERIFVKEQALERLGARRPELTEAAMTVLRLRAFYDLEHGRIGPPLPFEPTGADAEVQRAIEAIERLARA